MSEFQRDKGVNVCLCYIVLQLQGQQNRRNSVIR